ncbi:MAG: LytTR family DNA-binding domain-containing protein [Gammaproteobacteria bacterium]|nr:LytTR family DNA-binding domain-containing protein [Gammaproteobacteria bacterium]MDH3465179.1 LytTR family DNA-binding domain-containing protein [Gammaproteobacteria bacterium]
MRIVIADDEKLARARLRELISKIGEHTVVGEAVNGSEAVEKSLELKPTVLLLDIRMPVMDGLEAAMHVMSMENPPAVIFTTAYDQHALEAFEVNAVDYLLKPIRKDRLAAALQKARRTSMRQLRQLNQSQDEPAARTHISVHMRGQISLIPAQDIIYFMADSKYVTVRTSTEQHLIEDSLISLEDEFGDHFLRIHRNALVAVNYIRGIEKQPSGRWCVLLKSIDDKLDVSRRHTPAVRRWTRR